MSRRGRLARLRSALDVALGFARLHERASQHAGFTLLREAWVTNSGAPGRWLEPPRQGACSDGGEHVDQAVARLRGILEVLRRSAVTPISPAENREEQPQDYVQGDRDQQHRRYRNKYPRIATLYLDVAGKVSQPGQGPRPSEQSPDEQQQSSPD
jgi:hypothetical protein